MSAPVFLVPTERLAAAGPGDTLLVDGAEGRHAVSVRRLRVGEEVVLTDGAGNGARTRVAAVEGKDTLHAVVLERTAEPEAPLRLTVVQALPKGDRGELAVETMTEVGVDAVVPWSASRCVTQWRGERAAKSLARWRASAREAGKQARRLRFPTVHELMTTDQVSELLATADLGVVLHEEGAAPLATAPLPARGSIVLVVGPEGGLTEEEVATFAAAGARPHRLGPSVLRTSTAGVAAAASVFTRTGRWA
ncbi:16S rRNA methyltransferase [Wenjunlia vitaminophila]|uniref:Ribosomal RNA small subunit methyltransferase E n=1 Tax=Wenjunlia vitaminophila TaxID=76728 RepID=A0A0T6LLB1_WENVI|nr:16S rRNA (uracil(1498)-N(3))-methyltransferase [Wenjunlia vitaminophila]KRV46740.1 16S rRNA methyltransferase [Wenjunlia vitaminophila]